MSKYSFLQIDVFSEVPFGGNPLAVFTEAAGLNSDEMQKIAREMNLSETTFILTPEHPDADFKIRIFTPVNELPFAGHPVIGTAHAIVEKEMVRKPSPKVQIKMELDVGIVNVEVEGKDDEIEKITMHQRLPHFMDCPADVTLIASILDIDEQSIVKTGLAPEIVSTGLPFIIVPLDSLETVGELEINYPLINQNKDILGGLPIAVFTRETVDGTASVHVRVFATEYGVPEDPVTGSAAGCIASYLVKYGVMKGGVPFFIEQGLEVDRPGRVEVEIKTEGDNITDVLVGGKTVTILDGAIKFYK